MIQVLLIALFLSYLTMSSPRRLSEKNDRSEEVRFGVRFSSRLRAIVVLLAEIGEKIGPKCRSRSRSAYSRTASHSSTS